MVWYNLTPIENSSGPLVLMQTVNDNSGNWFAGAMLIFIFLVMLLTFMRNGTLNAFLASSFITTILAGLAYGFGILGVIHLSVPIVVLVISVIFKIWGEG